MAGEVAILKEQIVVRRQKAEDIAVEIGRRVQDIKGLLPPLEKIERLRLPLVAQLASEAVTFQEEYLQLRSEIETLKKELEG